MTSLTRILPPQTQPQSNLLTPSSQPVPLLSSSVANGYGYAHTAGILFYYYLRAGDLVREPLTALLQDVIPLALFQSLFCAICLPVAGTWYSGTGDVSHNGRIADGNHSSSKKSAAVSGAGSMRRRAGGQSSSVKGAGSGRSTMEYVRGGPWQTRVMPTILSLILTIAVPPVPLAILALVLGAPLYPTALIPHTLALAVHVAILSLLPIFYTHGVSSTAWRDVAAAWLPFDEAGVWSGAVGTMVGGWIGAIPIALDWDREWQKWPCTVVWGAVLGWAIGRVLTSGLRLGIGTRINLSVRESPSMQVAAPAAATTIGGKKQE